MDDIDKFWSYVDRSGGPDACWPWLRSRNDQGYGQFYPAGSRKVYAHRWLLGYLRGAPLSPVRGREDGCHRCHYPPCCNPAHLYVGTRKQNVGDAVAAGRLWMQKRTECPKGHPYQQGRDRRRCRVCDRAQQAQKRRERTTCKHGHPLSGDNLLLCSNGARKCRTCDARRVAQLRR